MEDKTVNQEKQPDCLIIKELIKQYHLIYLQK